jgi:hypothetical protein
MRDEVGVLLINGLTYNTWYPIDSFGCRRGYDVLMYTRVSINSVRDEIPFFSFEKYSVRGQSWPINIVDSGVICVEVV